MKENMKTVVGGGLKFNAKKGGKLAGNREP
jgi:hypothetical protein